MGFSSLFAIDHANNFLAVYISHSSGNDSVANLSDKYNKFAGGVIVLGVLPDQEDGMHNWGEKFRESCKLKVSFKVKEFVS